MFHFYLYLCLYLYISIHNRVALGCWGYNVLYWRHFANHSALFLELYFVDFF